MTSLIIRANTRIGYYDFRSLEQFISSGLYNFDIYSAGSDGSRYQRE